MKSNNNSYDENKIDFVIAWVDGNDKKWQEEKALYSPEAGTDSNVNRYRDWENLRYWFRGVEKFAPWVNKIYFVTWGHVPKWLDLSNPKLCIVNHKDYMPQEYLPCFSPNPLELNFHRIKGLSEQFVYFNDDMFLTKPVKSEDFFENGLPKDSALESAVMQCDYRDPFSHMLINDIAFINMHFEKKEVIRKYKKLWFSPKYGPDVIRNFLMSPYKKFASFKYLHLPSPFLKSTYEAVWNAEPEILDTICHNRFRGVFDVNQYVMRYWQYVTGNFIPQTPKMGRFFLIGLEEKECIDAIANGRYRMICLNDDGVTADNFENIKCQIIEAWEKLLSEKSSFEKE